MVTYVVTCQYVEGTFRGKTFLPKTDDFKNYTTALTVQTEKAIYPILLKELQKHTHLKYIKIYNIQKTLKI